MTDTFAYLVHSGRNVAPPATPAPVLIRGVNVGHLVQAGERVEGAVDHAARLGASVVGLDAHTGLATAGGAMLRDRTDYGVTNGSAFTAAVVHEQVRSLLDGAGRARVAVVGATGAVGATLTKLLVRGRDADQVLLVGRDERRLASLACNLGHRGVAVRTSRHVRDVDSFEVVVLLTAAANSIPDPDHLASGAVVLDATQPRKASPALAAQRPDVLVLDGSMVSIPSLRIVGGPGGLPDGRAYACFAETALLALSGHRGHFSIGIPDLDQVDHIRDLADRHAALGFTLAAPTSFGVAA